MLFPIYPLTHNAAENIRDRTETPLIFFIIRNASPINTLFYLAFSLTFLFILTFTFFSSSLLPSTLSFRRLILCLLLRLPVRFFLCLLLRLLLRLFPCLLCRFSPRLFPCLLLRFSLRLFPCLLLRFSPRLFPCLLLRLSLRFFSAFYFGFFVGLPTPLLQAQSPLIESVRQSRKKSPAYGQKHRLAAQNIIFKLF